MPSAKKRSTATPVSSTAENTGDGDDEEMLNQDDLELLLTRGDLRAITVGRKASKLHVPVPSSREQPVIRSHKGVVKKNGFTIAVLPKIASRYDTAASTSSAANFRAKVHNSHRRKVVK